MIRFGVRCMRQIFPRNLNIITIGGQLSNWFSSSRGGQSIFNPENVAIVILVMLVMLNLKGARREEDHGLEWLSTVFCGRCIRSFVGYSRLCSNVWDGRSHSTRPIKVLTVKKICH